MADFLLTRARERTASMPDFNSVLNIPAILNGGAIVLIAMSFVWMMVNAPRATARQEARVDKVIAVFREEMRIERESHHVEVALGAEESRIERAAHREEIHELAQALEKGFGRVDTRLAVEEMKRERGGGG
jgi:hypothetical protein